MLSLIVVGASYAQFDQMDGTIDTVNTVNTADKTNAVGTTDTVGNTSPPENANASSLITGMSAEAYSRYEYNRTFHHTYNASIAGTLSLNSVYNFKAGFSLGELGGGADVKTFVCASAVPFSRARRLGFALAYIYNGLPQYETHAHAILPMISYNARRAGAAVGPSFRFTSFFGETPIFEYVAMFSLYLNVINNDMMRVALVAGNFNEFYVGSKGVHSPKLVVDAHVRRNVTLINEFEYLQSGGDGLAATFYGFAWRGGVKYLW